MKIALADLAMPQAFLRTVTYLLTKELIVNFCYVFLKFQKYFLASLCSKMPLPNLNIED